MAVIIDQNGENWFQARLTSASWRIAAQARVCSVQCAMCVCSLLVESCTVHKQGCGSRLLLQGAGFALLLLWAADGPAEKPLQRSPAEKPSQRSPCRKAPANEILQRSPHRRAPAKRPLQKGPRCCIGTLANSVEGRPPCKKSPCRKAPSEKSCRKQNRVSDHLREVPLDRKSGKEGKWSQLELCTENSSCCWCNFFQWSLRWIKGYTFCHPAIVTCWLW